MGATAPDAVKHLVDRFDQDRKVFLSADYKEEQIRKAKTPIEQESLQRPDSGDGRADKTPWSTNCTGQRKTMFVSLRMQRSYVRSA